jgi:Arc/MetJ-type ribon-helix-helix transcriptional regulator
MRRLRKTKVKTEKTTINLTPTEIGQIDYLVERGLYTNRSDFIRLAIRKQTESHSGDINQFLAPEMPETEQRRYFGGLGIFRLTRVYVETLLTFGAKVHINVVGALTIDKAITREQFSQVMAGCRVHGKIFAEEEIKQLIKEQQ